ncbi:MAG: hypothetical protein KF767_06580 [Bdellovibrionaceae bacterium]|nr:hypothetical protein [Pseudobdellovibrionaceae bacterium]
MKSLKLALSAVLLTVSAQALAQTPKAVVSAYSKFVFTRYTETLTATKLMNEKIQAFTQAPSAESLEAAKTAWVEARKLYSTTEVFRFYSGPIDREDGPEGLINAWPLDEVYIDSVRGDNGAGFINDLVNYPTLSKELLIELNEKDGEKNISTGWHAIEFMLWGQDFNINGPGNRPYTDFTVKKNADRRRQYLSLVSDLLIEHLTHLAEEWNPANGANYVADFASPAKTLESLGFILTGTVQLAGFELSQERLFVAYDTQLQEDEHSCFSDTTHNDIVYNFLGIKEALTLNGGSVLELVKAKDAALATRLEIQLEVTEKAVRAIPAPFDQAIFSDDGRAAILTAVTELENLGADLKTAATLLGVAILQ